MRKLNILMGVLLIAFGCTQEPKTITSKFKPVLEVSLKENPQLEVLSTLALIGSFQKQDTTYVALYDRLGGTVHYFDQSNGKVKESFDVPINDSIDFFPAMIGVYDRDHIVYFNTENQTLVRTTRKEIRKENKVNVQSGEVTWRIENSYRNLKYDTAKSSIILTNWVNYSDGENGDSLMDERFLYVLLDTGSLEYEFIPIKPKYERFTADSFSIYDIMPHAIQDNRGRYVGFNSFLNEILIYENGAFQETTVQGTDYPIERVYLSRGYTMEEALDTLVGKYAHKIFYSSKHDAFVRRLKKWDLEDTRQINTNVVEVLNNQLEVTDVFDLGKEQPVFYQFRDNVYVKFVDRASQTLTLYEFTN